MSLLRFLKGVKKVHGTIGYFGLSDWWLSELTEAERKQIQDRFEPLGFSKDSLTKGQISSTSESVVGFLSGLASWFSKEEDRHIAYKLIQKGEELSSKGCAVLDVHFLYQTKIEISYKEREKPDGLESTVAACEQQISIAKKAAVAFKKKYGQPLPSHKGYDQLAIIREKQKNYFEAIRVSEQALAAGWTGDWEKRIERCKKRSANP